MWHLRCHWLVDASRPTAGLSWPSSLRRTLLLPHPLPPLLPLPWPPPPLPPWQLRWPWGPF